jgi:hypothetical protein
VIFTVKIKVKGKTEVHKLQASSWADAFSQAGNMADVVSKYQKGRIQYWVDGDGPFTHIR